MPSRRRSVAGLLATAGVFLAGCSGNSTFFQSTPTPQTQPQTTEAPPPAPGGTVGAGEVKAALILPVSASGNAGIAGQAMRNAAEMALAEFNAPNVQLLVKDDAGNTDAARQGAQQALDEGAAIILGPLFAQSVSAVGQVARARNVPVIAFSTDANVASRGVYLLSFLPESDVARIVQYAGSAGKRSYGALIPDNPYGTVVEAAFRQDVARRGGQVVAIERYPHDKAGMAGPVKNVAQAAARVDAIFIPDSGDVLPDVVQTLTANGVNTKKLQLLGTGLWDDPRIYSVPAVDGGWYAAPEFCRLPQLRAALSRPLQTGPGAHRNARLRRGRADRRAGEDPGPAAVLAGNLDQPFRLLWHRRAVPFPRRRHQRARSRGAARHVLGSAGHLATTAQLRLLDLTTRGEAAELCSPARRSRSTS